MTTNDLIHASPEIDHESACSSEETESPRSVGRWRRKKDEFVHLQVLKIREEDLHLGEDDLIENGKISAAVNGASSAAMSFVLFSRPVLPCSPLGSKEASSLMALH